MTDTNFPLDGLNGIFDNLPEAPDKNIPWTKDPRLKMLCWGAYILLVAVAGYAGWRKFSPFK